MEEDVIVICKIHESILILISFKCHFLVSEHEKLIELMGTLELL